MPLDFLPSDQEIIEILKIGAVILAVVLGYSYRHALLAAGRRVADRYFHRYHVAYVTHEGGADDHDEAPFTALNSPERPPFVQAVQEQAITERATIEAAARILATKVMGESAAIELLFDGVKRGGTPRYLALRDAVRERAKQHGWQAPEPAPPPEPPRVVKVYAGRPELEREIPMEPLP